MIQMLAETTEETPCTFFRWTSRSELRHGSGS